MNTRGAKKKLTEAALKFGGHIEDDSFGSYVRFQVCAPKGKFWVDSDGDHIAVLSYSADKRHNSEPLEREVIMAIERINYGVYDKPKDA